MWPVCSWQFSSGTIFVLWEEGRGWDNFRTTTISTTYNPHFSSFFAFFFSFDHSFSLHSPHTTSHYKMTTTKCLVTGGNGFLGRWIVQELIKRTDYHITILDIFIPTNATSSDRITYIAGDITDTAAVRSALKGHQICMHVASPPHHFPAEKFKKINIEGTQNVIDACLQEGVGRLIYTSSASVLQDGSPLENADETFPYPKTFIETYSETKAIAEDMILKANNNSTLLTCSLRPSGIFGPGDTQATPGFLEVMKKGQHRLQIGDNSGLFDWTYVENVAYSHVLAAEKLIAGSGVPGQVSRIKKEAEKLSPR